MYRNKGGKYGYSKHVINIAQNITFCHVSSWNANSEDVPVIIIQPPGGKWEGRDFTACAPRVQLALVYLNACNPGYA